MMQPVPLRRDIWWRWIGLTRAAAKPEPGFARLPATLLLPSPSNCRLCCCVAGICPAPPLELAVYRGGFINHPAALHSMHARGADAIWAGAKTTPPGPFFLFRPSKLPLRADLPPW